MAYKLIEAAQSRWRTVNAPHMVALVRVGAKFHNGNSSNARRIAHRRSPEGGRVKILIHS
jgi:hypothetical protein